ncbi:hypothetical protein JXB41_06075 [Candidatus Woesearchaeota archaeon]|nr:hypothetical protein [Candidatus Woesearchaeota archaeon]
MTIVVKLEKGFYGSVNTHIEDADKEVSSMLEIYVKEKKSKSEPYYLVVTESLLLDKVIKACDSADIEYKLLNSTK